MLKLFLSGTAFGAMIFFSRPLDPIAIDPKIISVLLLVSIDAIFDAILSIENNTFDDADRFLALSLNLIAAFVLIELELHLVAAFVFSLSIVKKIADLRVHLLKFFRRLWH